MFYGLISQCAIPLLSKNRKTRNRIPIILSISSCLNG
jgi:hypothetical protein